MRDPRRIAVIIKKLQELWELVPDWRLGQLIFNLARADKGDYFYIEDDEWEGLINKFLKEHK